MKQFLFVFVAILSFSTLSAFLNQSVHIEMSAQSEVVAGSEVLVKITIEKGSLGGFARFQQEVPYGFTVTPVSSANADFSFEGQKVRLLWLKMPTTDKIEISYKLIPNERVTGSIDLSATFSYIEDNERRSVSTTPQMLAVRPNPNIPVEKIVDIKDYEKIMIADSHREQNTARVACLRQTPTWSAKDNAFIVNLLVNKDRIKEFAKIEDIFPAGFRAIAIDTKGATFQSDERIARFLWRDLPQSQYFVVSYKIIPNDVAKRPQSVDIQGAFSYTTAGVDRTISIVERSENLLAVNDAQLKNILTSVGDPTFIAGLEYPSSSFTEDIIPSPGNKTDKKDDKGSNTKPDRTDYRPSNDKTGLTPESGIYYRVQIAAGHRPLNPQRVFRKYRLEYSVAREQHEGWYKYSVGSFRQYKDARDYRVHLANTTEIQDAFIAAYSDGRRITVQEALMALNQKWYK